MSTEAPRYLECGRMRLEGEAAIRPYKPTRGRKRPARDSKPTTTLQHTKSEDNVNEVSGASYRINYPLRSTDLDDKVSSIETDGPQSPETPGCSDPERNVVEKLSHLSLERMKGLHSVRAETPMHRSLRQLWVESPWAPPQMTSWGR